MNYCYWETGVDAERKRIKLNSQIDKLSSSSNVSGSNSSSVRKDTDNTEVDGVVKSATAIQNGDENCKILKLKLNWLNHCYYTYYLFDKILLLIKTVHLKARI